MRDGDRDPGGSKRRAIEQLLEDESLTDDLVDEAARLLLDWGVTQLDTLFQSAQEPSPAELDACALRLRRLMRRVNRRAGRASADQQAERVREILSHLQGAGDIASGADADRSAP
jgi:hypothetical protein